MASKAARRKRRRILEQMNGGDPGIPIDRVRAKASGTTQPLPSQVPIDMDHIPHVTIRDRPWTECKARDHHRCVACNEPIFTGQGCYRPQQEGPGVDRSHRICRPCAGKHRAR